MWLKLAAAAAASAAAAAAAAARRLTDTQGAVVFCWCSGATSLHITETRLACEWMHTSM